MTIPDKIKKVKETFVAKKLKIMCDRKINLVVKINRVFLTDEKSFLEDKKYGLFNAKELSDFYKTVRMIESFQDVLTDSEILESWKLQGRMKDMTYEEISQIFTRQCKN